MMCVTCEHAVAYHWTETGNEGPCKFPLWDGKQWGECSCDWFEGDAV